MTVIFRRVRTAAALAAATVLVSALAACGGSGSGSAPGSGPGPVSISFWGWAPGYSNSVALFNKTHKDVHVTFQTVPSGPKGGYSKMLDAVKAGNAPCLAQVGYETLPTFAATGALQDISSYVDADKGQYVPWTWKMVSVGPQVYGIPVDTGPEALFYRKDLFRKYGLTVPRTWAQFAADAAKFHAANPANHLTTTPQDSYDLAGFAWQAGGNWFGTAGNKWQVNITDPATQKVAQYWQGLLAKKQVISEATLDTQWYSALNSGHLAALVGAVWNGALIATGLPGESGKWAVAPMPQWSAGQDAAGNEGGSSTAVLKGCTHPQQAARFAEWMSTDPASATNLIKVTGIYPAATSALSLPAVNQPQAYFGGQNIYPVFRDAAAHTATTWQWGPTMTQVEADFASALTAAGSGQGTITGSLSTVQAKTITAMTSQGLQVSHG